MYFAIVLDSYRHVEVDPPTAEAFEDVVTA